MTAAAPSRLRRLVAVALFCGLPLILLALVVGNLAEIVTSRELAAEQDATAAQMVKEVAKRRARQPTPQDTSALFLTAASASLARAELEERATRFVETAGGHLEEAQFTDSPEQEVGGTVAMQLSFTIDNNGLRDLLYAVETATPLLNVSELQVRPVDAQTAAATGRAQLLHVDLTCEGYFRKETG